MVNQERFRERQMSLPEPFLESLDWAPGKINTGVPFEDFLVQIYNSPISLGLAREPGDSILHERLSTYRPHAYVTEKGSAMLVRGHVRCKAEEYLAVIGKMDNLPYLYTVDIITAMGVATLANALLKAKGYSTPLTNLINADTKRLLRETESQTAAWESTFSSRTPEQHHNPPSVA